MRLAQLGEFGLIELLSRGAPVGEGVVTGIGDDTAVVRATPGADLLLTCDLLHEGVHFRREWYADRPELLGRKALAVSVSDIASMGGQPRYCLVTLAMGQELSAQFIERVYAGLHEFARECGVSVVGGDTVGLAQGLLLDILLTGEVDAGRALLRSGAQPGDLIAVTGWCGLARAGLQLLEAARAAPPAAVGRAAAAGHAAKGGASGPPASRALAAERHQAIAGQLCPPVRLAAAQRMAATGMVHAMSDTSDGPANQVHHICRRSGVGAVIDRAALPVAAAAAAIARDCGVDPLVWGLWGGEDYELMVTFAPGDYGAVADAAGDARLTVIGEVSGSRSGPGPQPGPGSEPGPILLRWPDGRREPLAFGGYEHFRAEGTQ